MILSIHLTLTSFSQTGTDTTENKCFPIPVVKSMIKDLISGDECKEELKLTEMQLKETEKKVNLKDSVINSLLEKETNYITMIVDEKTKYGVLDNHIKKVESDLNILKIENKFIKIVSGAAALVLLTLLIIK